MLAVSGQVPLDAQGRPVREDQPEAQARQVFENLRTVLEAAGARLEDVVKITAYLTDLGDLATFRQVRDQYFAADHPPANSLVQVTRLIHPAFRFEAEAWAVVPEEKIR
jgi:reactive intermediate/imine deaminase